MFLPSHKLPIPRVQLSAGIETMSLLAVAGARRGCRALVGLRRGFMVRAGGEDQDRDNEDECGDMFHNR